MNRIIRVLNGLRRAGGLALAMAVVPAFNAAGAIVPPDRLPNGNALAFYEVAGVPGGIPNRTNIFVNVATTTNSRYKCYGDGQTDNLVAIQNAINDCPANQVVYVPAGTYRVSSQIRIQTKSFWTVRGDGPGRTIFTGGSGGLFTLGDMPWKEEWPAPIAIESGAVKGSTNITIASTATVSVGNLLHLEQRNDGTVVFGFGTGGSNPAGDRMRGNTHNLNQRVMVTGINGKEVTFHPALNYDFNPALSPAAVPFGSKTGPRFVGIEDLTVQGSPGGMGIWFIAAYASWIKNVEITKWNTWGVEIQFSVSCEFRDSYIHQPAVYAWSRGYPLQLDTSNNVLIENNIVWHFQADLILQGCSSGNVFGYNAAFQAYNLYNGVDTMLASFSGNHTPYPTCNLWEGNYGSAFHPDFYYGPSSRGTLLRNYFTGTDPDIRQNRIIINIDSRQWSNSVVGNILGSVGTNAPLYAALPNTTITWANTSPLTWIYDSGTANFPYTANVVFRLGYPYIGNNSPGSGFYPGSSSVTAFDLTVRSNTIIHGNWDIASKAIRWQPGISETNIPRSFYLPGKPAWFGNLNWPPYDPYQAGMASLTNTPAGYRFVFGSRPDSGPVNHPPTANASGSPLSGSAPLAVSFTCNASDPELAPLSFSWNFGDGTVSSQQNPAKTYATDGTYAAYVTVSDGTNAVQSNPITIAVGNQPPMVSASATPRSGVRPLVVAFSSAGSSDPEGESLSYLWNFGNGVTSTAPNPTNTYPSAGVFTVRLTISDGVKTSTTSNVTISVFEPSTGLVAAYGFESGSGTLAADWSGNGNDGTLSAATWTTGKFGKALSFNGSSSVVVVPDAASLDLTTEMTVMAWLYPTASGGVRNVVFKEGSSYFMFGSTPEIQSPGVGGSFASGALYSPSSLPLNTWSHVTATYDGTAMAFYVNGARVATKAQAGSIIPSTGSLMIGGNASVANRHWAGIIDELRIFNRAISASEISAAMNTPVTISSERPKAPSSAFVPSIIRGVPTSGAAPLPVTFTRGSNWLSTYVLDFGDGSSVDVPDSVHLYSVPGIYSVSVIQNIAGASSQVMYYTNYITVTNAP